MDAYSSHKEGTFAYIKLSRELFVHTGDGWRQVEMGRTLPKTVEITAPRKPVQWSSCAGMPHLKLVALNRVVIPKRVNAFYTYDSLCYRGAHRNGLEGTYRAVLSSDTQSLRWLVSKKDSTMYPICNMHDEMLAQSWADLMGRFVVDLEAPILDWKIFRVA